MFSRQRHPCRPLYFIRLCLSSCLDYALDVHSHLFFSVLWLWEGDVRWCGGGDVRYMVRYVTVLRSSTSLLHLSASSASNSYIIVQRQREVHTRNTKKKRESVRFRTRWELIKNNIYIFIYIPHMWRKTWNKKHITPTLIPPTSHNMIHSD